MNVNCLYCEPKTCNNVTGSCERCLMGFYGDKCEQTCPNTCSTCEKSNGRCSKCIDGWFGENCNFECVHCFSCNKESGACETCQPNYWGPQCQNECEYNCHVCRIDTGDCIHCAQGYFGENCARQCGHCRRGFCDQATGSCQFGCNDGFYGESCEKSCPQNCMVCNQTDGECLMCHAKMWGSQCDYTCPLNCDFCHVSTGECLECVEGFHGAKCEEPCGNCIGRVCVKDTGYCEYGCEDGWFGGTCNQKCIQNCSKCNSKDECIVCTTGLAGSRCDIQCPEICNACTKDMISGLVVCSECASGFDNPQKNCSCTMSKCTKQTSTLGYSFCEECESNTGWYLSQGSCCPCKHCAGGNQFCSSNGTCLNGCEPHYYPKDQGCDVYCDIDHCTWCEPFFGYGKVCVGCDIGYYLSHDGSCYPCSANCKGGSTKCHPTGACIDGCEEGWFGDKCDTRCHDKYCEVCDNGASTCEVCRNGFYGEHCTQTCLKNCTKCSKDTGSCLECVSGRYSEDCTKTCPNCDQNDCHITGECLIGCKEGFFGSNCDKQCIQGCSKCSNAETCDECYIPETLLNGKCYSPCSRCFHGMCSSDGKCKNGCVDGWHGTKCDLPCPKECSKCNSSDTCSSCVHGFTWNKNKCISTCTNCVDQLCSAVGVCDKGCKDGWFGDKCIEKCFEGCISCGDGFNCDKCMSGYQLAGNQCISGCNFCVEENCDLEGNCHLGCKEGHFGSKCTQLCLKGCRTCNSLEDCTACSPGFTMIDKKCESPCENCEGGSCNKNGDCLSGCKSGWFGQRCDQKCKNDNGEPSCEQPCGPNCITCGTETNGVSCTKCKPGYYANNGLCQKCSSTCKNSMCEGTTAQCLEGCEKGWKGILCNIPEDGTKLPITGCEGSCLTCNLETKKCSSCIAGMWGENCQQKCPSRCTLCEQRTGQCMIVCSKYCNKISQNFPSCNNVTGACVQGCEDGWYGEQCQNKCALNCINGVCDQELGHCSYGCSPGWKGITCGGNFFRLCIHIKFDFHDRRLAANSAIQY